MSQSVRVRDSKNVGDCVHGCVRERVCGQSLCVRACQRVKAGGMCVRVCVSDSGQSECVSELE